MDFFIESSELLAQLSFVRNALEKRATIPVLSHFLLEADGFELRIAATDLGEPLGTDNLRAVLVQTSWFSQERLSEISDHP